MRQRQEDCARRGGFCPVQVRFWANYYASESQIALRMRDGEVLRGPKKRHDAADALGNTE